MNAHPHYVVWELTLRCDLACRHCGSRGGKAREVELTREEALRTVRELAQLGTREVTLIGGEAYLHDAWLDIAQAITSAGMACSMVTAGRGLSAERAHAARDAGIHLISVSVDGTRGTHDLQRNFAGSFDAAIQALLHIRSAGMTPAINSQINRLSMHELSAIADIAIQEQIKSWQVHLTVPMGRATERLEWLLQPYDLLIIFPRLAKEVLRLRRHGINFWPGNNVGYFGHFEHILRGEKAHSVGCIAGKFALGIESDGTLKGCPSLPTESYQAGNIRHEAITYLWEHASALRFTRDRSADECWGYCAKCYYREECRSGCTWVTQTLLGRRGNNPYCHHRAFELAQIGVQECLQLVEEAKGRPFDHGRFELTEAPLSEDVKMFLCDERNVQFLAESVHCDQEGKNSDVDHVSPMHAAPSQQRRRLPVL